MLKLSEANRRARQLVINMAQEKLYSDDTPVEDKAICFLVRDGLKGEILDPHELEEYNDSYGVDLLT